MIAQVVRQFSVLAYGIGDFPDLFKWRLVIFGADEKAAPLAPRTAVTAAVPVRRHPDLLVANARTIAVAHRDQHGEDITPGKLAVRLRVPTPVATDILAQLRDHPPVAATLRSHNGSTVGGTA